MLLNKRRLDCRPTLCAVLLGTCLQALGADAASPAGSGVLKPFLDAGLSFRPQSDVVAAVEVGYEISWKFWSLMGEPVANYHLTWQWRSIQLKVASGAGGVVTYWPQTLPPELKKAADDMELYLDGHASVAEGADAQIRHRFNTGVAVRAGGERSYNVPGSPGWADIFFSGSLQACGEGKKPPSYLNADSAKQRFVKGLALTDFRPCPESGVSNLASLEVAISRLCRGDNAAAKYPFCPKSKPVTPPPSAAAIDDAFAKLDEKPGKQAVSKVPSKASSGGAVDDAFASMESNLAEKERQRLAREELERLRATRRKAFAAQCTAQIGEKTRCDENQCGAAPPKELVARRGQCSRREPAADAHRGREGSYLIIQRVECDPDVMAANPAYASWLSCSSESKRSCERAEAAQRRVEACIAERQVAQEKMDAAMAQEKPPSGLLPSLKKGLKDHLDCKPQSDKPCPPAPKGQNPGGIRG